MAKKTIRNRRSDPSAPLRAGQPSRNGSIQHNDNRERRDPARDIAHAPPNFGRYTLPHIATFQGLVGAISRAYRNPDEAIKNSLDNARFMRNDTDIMECLEQRQRVVALLDWHLEVDGPKLPYHEALKDRLTEVLKRTPRFTEYRRCLLEAIWYGRQGAMHAFKWHVASGRRDIVIRKWRPVCGDKLIFRYDDGHNTHPDDQIGLRVGAHFKDGDLVEGRRVEATEAGLVTWLSTEERTGFLAIHKHMIEDAAYESPLDSGGIHGIGVRSRIYWTWFQKQELLALLIDYLERSALGFEIWYYPEGNPKAKADIEDIAHNRVGKRNLILFPKPIGDDQQAYGVEHFEPSAAGADAFRSMLHDYFGHKIKRYILGQVLTSEAAATGLGSGVADLHLQTLLDIVKYDATNLEETITQELLLPLKRWNDPKAANVDIRFVLNTQTADVEQKLQAFERAWNMGARLKESDVMDMIGASIPTAEDRVLQNPTAMQQMRLWEQTHPGADGAAGWQPPDPTAGMNIQDLFGPLAPSDAGEQPQPAMMGNSGIVERYRKPGQADAPMAKPLPIAIPAPGMDQPHRIGETKQFAGHTYRLNENSRWERVDDDAKQPDQPGSSTPADAEKPTGPKLPVDSAHSTSSGQAGSPQVEDSVENRHQATEKHLAGVNQHIGGMMQQLRGHGDYKKGGTVIDESISPEAAQAAHAWMTQNQGKYVEGGKVLDLGQGQMGFGSQAGSMVVQQRQDGSWVASYTVQTRLVAKTAGIEQAETKEGHTLVSGEPGALKFDTKPVKRPEKTKGEPTDGMQSTGVPADPTATAEREAKPELRSENPTAGTSDGAPATAPKASIEQPQPETPQQRGSGIAAGLGGAAKGMAAAHRDAFVKSASVPPQEAKTHIGRFVQEAINRGYKSPEDVGKAYDAARDALHGQGATGTNQVQRMNDKINQHFPHKQTGASQSGAANSQSQPQPEPPHVDHRRVANEAKSRMEAAMEEHGRTVKAMAHPNAQRRIRKELREARAQWYEADRVARHFEKEAEKTSKPSQQNPTAPSQAKPEPAAGNRAMSSAEQQDKGILDKSRRMQDWAKKKAEEQAEADRATHRQPGERPAMPPATEKPTPPQPTVVKSEPPAKREPKALKNYPLETRGNVHVWLGDKGAAGVLAEAGLSDSADNIDAVHKAIQRGDLKGRDQIKQVLDTAKKIHARGNLQDDDHAAVKEALRRRTERAERARAPDPFVAAAEEHGIRESDIREMVEHLSQEERQQQTERETIKADIRKRTGLTARHVSRMENENLDHSRIQGFDQRVADIANDYPELGLGQLHGGVSSAEHDQAAEKILAMIREGLTPPKPKHEYIAYAIKRLTEVDKPMTPEDRAAMEAIPFRRHGDVERYGAGQLFDPPRRGEGAVSDVPDHRRHWTAEAARKHPKDNSGRFRTKVDTAQKKMFKRVDDELAVRFCAASLARRAKAHA